MLFRSYNCEICGKKFSTAWYVRVHRKSHSGERPYVCHNCGKGFMLPNVLQVHLRKCEKNNPSAASAVPSKSSRPVNGPADDPPASPALPQQGFLEGGGGGFNNGSYNQRYELGVPAGMPTPPFHHAMSGEVFDAHPFLADQGQQVYPGYSSGNVPAHFLANDRPPDEGGGLLPPGSLDVK